MTGKEAEVLVKTEKRWVRQASAWRTNTIRLVVHRTCLPPSEIKSELFMVGIDKFTLDNWEEQITDGNIPSEMIEDCSPFSFSEEDCAANDWQVFQLVYDD